MNPSVKDKFVIRAKMITFLRRYLDNLGFLEVCYLCSYINVTAFGCPLLQKIATYEELVEKK